MPNMTNPIALAKPSYSENYKESVFLLWYKSGKPGVHRLRDLLAPDDFGNIPSATQLGQWIREDFSLRASMLDEQVRRELEQRLVKEKVEMLTRHANVAKQLQQKALEILNEAEHISPPQAIRLWVESVRIERESSGIPAALEKMIDKSDEELLDELQSLIEKSPTKIDMMIEGGDSSDY